MPRRLQCRAKDLSRDRDPAATAKVSAPTTVPLTPTGAWPESAVRSNAIKLRDGFLPFGLASSAVTISSIRISSIKMLNQDNRMAAPSRRRRFPLYKVVPSS